MKKALLTLFCLAAMVAAGTGLKAQEVTIVLNPGWNWISFPTTDTLDISEALGSFTPMVGDMIKSKWGYSSYMGNGRWRGYISEFYPGNGYMYKSNRQAPVILTIGHPLPQLSVTTAEPTDITAVSAVVGFNIAIGEGNHVFACGVCWGTEPNPNIDGSTLVGYAAANSQNFLLDGLTSSTTYYVRAYMVTDYGLAYGGEQSFTTESGIPTGAINGLFSVSEHNQVYFSQGNLQYQASTNTWRFAVNQWDFIGEGNANASSTYDGWIDLFCYGTSGYNHGAVCYQPWSTSMNNNDYWAYGDNAFNLLDLSGEADWGYNPISNGGNTEGLWRTMTIDEWYYILLYRSTTSGIRFVAANVNGFDGWILLPDNWESSWFVLNNANDMGASYENNVISMVEWNAVFESHGAVFLPKAGWKLGQSEFNLERGTYWSSSSRYQEGLAFSVSFGGCLDCNKWRCDANSIRLVQFAQAPSFNINATISQEGYGTINGTGIYEVDQTCTLAAVPNEGCVFLNWKENGDVVPAENPYTFVVRYDRNLEATFYETSTYPLTYSYNENDHTATLTGRVEGVELTGDLVIPETVIHNGESYSVTIIGDNAFSGCSNLTSVEFPYSLVSIGGGAFWGCGALASIEFPNSIVSIGSEAFRDCSGLTEIVIPSSVTSMVGINPFGGCSNLAQITVESGNAYYDSRDDSHAIIETATNKLVSGSLTTVIPNTVVSIGQNAFWSIPVSSINIPASVNHLAPYAVAGISSMIVLAEVPPTLDWCAFCDQDKSIPVYVPCGSLDAYQNAEGWNDFANFIEMCSDHAYVDLGLPSGLLWATCNIGADAPEDYGFYFAWGETQPKDNYDWNTYQYCNGSSSTLTKYCNKSNYGYNGFTDNLTTLLPEDDAATANWGSDWRMPTKEEFQELYNNTTVTWTTQNGVNGRLFTASNGNSLFLPAAGCRYDGSLNDVGSYGYYWSSSLDTDYPRDAWYFDFGWDYYGMFSGYRSFGQSVRPVRSGQN